MPFNIQEWPPLSEGFQFVNLSKFAVVGAIGLAFSQFVMRKWFGMNNFLIKQFLVWTLFELLFLTFLMTIIFVDVFGEADFFYEFIITLKHTFFIIIIPYSIILLILSLFHSKSKLEALKKVNSKDKLKNQYLKLPDEKGNIKFTLQLQDLLYLESTDNYVFIYYRSNDIVKKELLRNSLKNLENRLKNQPIKRCHRSYMVNLLNLNMIKKRGQKFVLQLKYIDQMIPVSKTYQEEFNEFLQKDN